MGDTSGTVLYTGDASELKVVRFPLHYYYDQTAMDEMILKYVANRVIEDIRRGHNLQQELARALNTYPCVDHLRSCVTVTDVPILIQAASMQRADLELVVSLLQPFANNPQVKEFLLERWNTETDFRLKNVVMWQLLNDENMTLKMHQNAYEFVDRHRAEVNAMALSWYGDKANVLYGIKRRLSDPKFPRSKDWLYLCMTRAASDQGGAIELLKKYENSSKSFVAKVAADLLTEFEAVVVSNVVSK